MRLKLEVRLPITSYRAVFIFITDRMILTGRRMDVNVLFEVVERVNVVIKLPRAKLDSVAGIDRCKEIP